MSRIPMPNYTQIPNIFFDYWMEKLSVAQQSIFLVICRKTFGFHKQSDDISAGQIMKMTGLKSKSSLFKNIKVLEKLRLIKKTQNMSPKGDNDPNSYEIDVLYPNEKGGSVLGVPGVVLLEHQGGVLGVPTKETLTKETNTKRICPDTSIEESGPAEIEIKFCFKEKKFKEISKNDLKLWTEAYPSVNLHKEIAQAEDWCINNPSRAKKKKKWRIFLSEWFKKSEESAVFKKTKADSSPPIHPNVIENKKLVDAVFNKFPDLRDTVKRFGDKCIVQNSTGRDVYFDLNPQQFREVFSTMIGVKINGN